ncbi:MAG TPA: succinylglutamate desuccinylase/aspartoacylase family protein [Bacillota bacterium]|nr:succinylglutamate desuccinylase/aspartoacylase family protein [Bacillota bacterium]HOA15748.1 succinylglutamate desuccinylase/aspartoacylase family protein [Bacillota bacterium]HOG53276.1 succinylglutamate desuccinylase/aspartoacylase family protein [Bacillota bacterium]
MKIGTTKAILALAAVAVIAVGGGSLYAHRNYKETVVLGPGVTRVTMLSEYFDKIKGTAMDTKVFILEGEEPGGGVLMFGGAHACEPSGVVAAVVAIESMDVTKGKVVVIPHVNRSGSTTTQASGGFPLFFNIETKYGPRKFRMGDRNSSAVDQWPDPEIQFHYPTGQSQSYVEARNINRCFPGNPNGNLTEQAAYAVMQLIEKENLDIVMDMHEAELFYPVTNCIVAPDKSMDIAAFALLSAPFEIVTFRSPQLARGFSHREIGDPATGNAAVYPFLFEAPEPFLDQPTGPKTEKLLLDGKDQFLGKLGDLGLLFCPYDPEEGKTMDNRVGRHFSTAMLILEEWSYTYEDKQITFDAPTYDDIMANGLKEYFLDPNAEGAKIEEM